MEWKLFATMALLLGAVAGSSCDSGKDEEKLCPGEDRTLDPAGGCCDDMNNDQDCDKDEKLEDLVDVNNCVMCDDFNNPGNSTTMWDISSMTIWANNEFNNGMFTLTESYASCDVIYDLGTDFSFEVRYRANNIMDCEDLGGAYICIRGEGFSSLDYGCVEIYEDKLSFVTTPPGETLEIPYTPGNWDTIRMDSSAYGVEFYLNEELVGVLDQNEWKEGIIVMGAIPMFLFPDYKEGEERTSLDVDYVLLTQD